MEGGRRSTLESTIGELFDAQVDRLTACDEFRALETGEATREAYDAFIENVARAHLRSPQLLAFLYALAPPAAAADLLHNLLEELGRDADGARPHPDLLRELLVGAGLGHRLEVVQAQADDDLRRIVVEPLLHGTLRDVGLAALVEIVAFEYMLARVSERVARALAAHRGLSASALTWFTHHSEVDARHAEQGLAGLEAYARYYELADEEAVTIARMTLRDDVFTRRYFREFVVALTGADWR
jgi:pyrroloquinoline quinone (PQQ) biosynthesis protein C